MTESQLHCYVTVICTVHYMYIICIWQIYAHPCPVLANNPSYGVCCKRTSHSTANRTFLALQVCVPYLPEGRATTWNCTYEGSISLPFSFSPTFFSPSPTHIPHLAHPQKRCLKIEARRWTGARDCHGNTDWGYKLFRPAGKLTIKVFMQPQYME